MRMILQRAVHVHSFIKTALFIVNKHSNIHVQDLH
jgi:hypothetical protein